MGYSGCSYHGKDALIPGFMDRTAVQVAALLRRTFQRWCMDKIGRPYGAQIIFHIQWLPIAGTCGAVNKAGH